MSAKRGQDHGFFRDVSWYFERAARYTEFPPGILEAVRAEVRGHLHLACEGIASWFDLAVATVEEAARRRWTPSVRVEPVQTGAVPCPAVRPAYSVLGLARARQLGIRMPHWRVYEVRDVVLDEREPLPTEEVLDILEPSRQQVVHADHLEAFVEKTTAEMRTDETRASGYEHSTHLALPPPHPDTPSAHPANAAC